MCGIVGCAGNLEYRDKDVMQVLIHLCELRGEDSTGFFSVPKSGAEASITKVVGPSRNLFDTTAWEKLQMSTKRVVIGHGRKATVGGISKKTAHPFNYQSITGVHNGTLKNWRHLPGDSEDTDSMTLFENFARVGVRETIEATEGAYALIWWDETDETLNILRNNERPLYYCFTDDYKRIFWASEPWMLQVATDKAGVKRADLTPRETTTATIMAVEENTWWRIKPGRVGAKEPLTFLAADEGHTEELKGGVNPAKYVSPPFRGTVVSPFTNHHGSSLPPSTGSTTAPVVDAKDDLPQLRLASPAVTGTAVASTSTNSSSSDTTKTESESAKKDSLPSRPTLSLVQTSKNAGSGGSAIERVENETGEPIVVGYNGLVLNKAEFETLVDPNCMWCQSPFAFDEIIEDPTIVGDWSDEDTFICSDCVKCCYGYSKGAF